MDLLRTPKEVMELGRALVKELGAQADDDTLIRWMSHHISELIVEVENTVGSDKSVVEDRCREAILALWNHIGVFPRGHRPLENVEPVLATIQALAPENQAYFYQSEAQSQIDRSTLSDQAKEFLELSLEIDYSARLLIDMCLKKVANEIVEEKRDILQLARSLETDTYPGRILRILVGNQEESSEEQKSEVFREAIKTLTSRRRRLRKMIEMSELLVNTINENIAKMQKSLVS
jgi:hypothetical protein